MPGSPTTQDRSGTRVVAPVRFAFRIRNHVGVLDEKYFVAQWLDCPGGIKCVNGSETAYSA
jgi:hypothetical protein